MNRVIAVNATALTNGGGLSILRQFVSHLNDEDHYYIFVSDSVVFNVSHKINVHFISTCKKSILQRLMWDFRGFRQWFKLRGITPDVVFSLQNTSIFYPHVRQIIYLHQGVSLASEKWSFFKKTERVLAIYRYIYPLFIFMYATKQTQYIVQTKWMKKALCDRFNGREQNVYVIKPDIVRVDVNEVVHLDLPEDFTLFYPANECSYKNHIELFRALYELKSSGFDMTSIGLYLTINKNKQMSQQIEQFGLQENVHFLGTLNYQEMMRYYKSCTMLVYPSYIESFGLPLLEAAMFGKPIVAANVEYAKEVLKGYTNVSFAAINSSIAWKNAILNGLADKKKNVPFVPEYDSSWSDLFQLIQSS